jgi:ABC-2 type transport system ATP-binding protein
MAEGGKAVVMSTHLLLEAEGLADQVVVMDHGRVLVSGDAGALTKRFWPTTTVVVEAESPERLDLAAALPYVRSYVRNGAALVEVDDPRSVADLVDALVAAGARLTRVEPRTPSLEELYFAVRQRPS